MVTRSILNIATPLSTSRLPSTMPSLTNTALSPTIPSWLTSVIFRSIKSSSRRCPSNSSLAAAL
ncbi:unnamed protein product [Oikopleura dioica]|uniref:Uncharacterized protein n=1 Tax=Oikopleura dioica TaxID=34765 RepID=E4XQX6_OIKDI|nr:unnamed protein product [Oikopleura dioica]